MSAPTQLDEYDDDLGLPSRPVPRLPADQLPPLPPRVVDDWSAARPEPDRPPLELPPRVGAAAPRPRAQRQPKAPLRVDVLALLLAAVVCVCVTVLALKGVTVPDVLQTIGYVSAGGAFGLATAGNVGRRP